MPSASITVESTPRDASSFTVTDTSDYTGVVVVKTDLIVTDPNQDSYNVDIFDENFNAVSESYSITPAVLGLSSSTFSDGVYSFIFTAELDDESVLVSPTVYFLMDVNVKKCWADMFEDAIDDGDDAMTEAMKKRRTEIRELIQGAEENLNQSRYVNASNILAQANELCETKCGDC